MYITGDNREGIYMFGLSKKEKLLQLVSNSVDACLDVYRDGVRALVLKEMNGEITSERFRALEQTLREEYNKRVAEHAIEKFAGVYPENGAKARSFTGATVGVHALYSHLCDALTGKAISSIDQYSMMTAMNKGFEKEEQEIRDSLAK